MSHCSRHHRAEAGEAALTESEKRFSVFMTHLPAVVFIRTRQAVFCRESVSAGNFGWRECVGKTTEELLPSEVAELMMADDRRALTEVQR